MMNVFKIFILIFVLSATFISSANQAIAQNDYGPFEHRILGEELTSYKITEKSENTYQIEAIGKNSASGLYSDDPAFFASYPEFLWSWRVDDAQESANIAIKGMDDYAASLQFLFGKQRLFPKPKVLAYAWVGNDTPIGSVIKSPRAPDHFRTIVLGNASTPLGKFIEVTRNLREDYKLAYGEYPSKELNGFGVFTDNDQTGESVQAYYRIYR